MPERNRDGCKRFLLGRYRDLGHNLTRLREEQEQKHDAFALECIGELIANGDIRAGPPPLPPPVPARLTGRPAEEPWIGRRIVQSVAAAVTGPPKPAPQDIRPSGPAVVALFEVVDVLV